MRISIVEGSLCLWAGAGLEGAQLHWHTGQGDKEGGGGEEGLGLGKQDVDGDMDGIVEAGQEPNATWHVKCSLLRKDAARGETGTAMGSG